MSFPVLVLLLGCGWAQAVEGTKAQGVRNDRIYPAEAAVRGAIDCDGSTFRINGKRVFLASGTIHYPRVPRDLWRDRLLRLKRAGMTCVETYAFWNYHELKEGEIDFTGEKDLGAFLQIAQEVGLYAIVRVGPYVCAEWNAGGFPLWLRRKPGVVVRTANVEFLRWNDHWYDAVLPVVAARQIHRGGNVIMVQLENEHPQGWGVVENDPYFVHLHDVARRAGLAVPLVMSGLHHGPAPFPPVDFDPGQRTTPWFSTEFWAGWFDRYGAINQKRQREIEDATWRIAAHGGGGYNYYMAHGGTNFAAWSDNSTSASYDFGAIIGQAGDLRPTYYRSKRTNQFATGLTEALAAARDGGKTPGKAITGASLESVRTGPGGSFAFLNAREGGRATLEDGSTVGTAPTGLLPLVRDLVVDPRLTVVRSNLPVLGLARAADALTVIVYGHPGETASLVLKGPDLSGDPVALAVPAEGSAAREIRQGDRTVRLLVVTRDASLRTWIIGDPGRESVVVGPAYVQEVAFAGESAAVTYEQPLGEPAPGRIDVYAGAARQWRLQAQSDRPVPAAPALGTWSMALCPETAVQADTAGWIRDQKPVPLGSDDVDSLYGWYRTTVDAPAAGPATVTIDPGQAGAGERTRVFVNGRLVADRQAALVAGANQIAVLYSIEGRNKAYQKLVAWDTYDVKTLQVRANAVQQAGKALAPGPWFHRGGADPGQVGTWSALGPTEGRPAYYRTTFTARRPGATGPVPIYRIDTRSLSRGSVWLNGRNLGHYPEKIPVNGIYLPECWLKDGANDLAIFDEEGADPRAVALFVEIPASREVLVARTPAGPGVTMTVPPENPPRDLAALNRGNLAWKAPASADASDKGAQPSAASDGDPDTRWTAPDAKPGHWLAVDLGEVKTIGTCEVWWFLPSRMYRFRLEGSVDGKIWESLGDQNSAVPTSPDSPSEVSRLLLKQARARHLRITGGADGAKLGICDLRVLAP